MNDDYPHPAAKALRERLADTAHIELRPLDVEDACKRYADEGYEVTTQLRDFLSAYGEMTVTWFFGPLEVHLQIGVEQALDLLPMNVKVDAGRLGQGVLPLGIVFDTEEAVLLAESGEIFFTGDAGMQRGGDDFDTAVEALVTDNWDKTFF